MTMAAITTLQWVSIGVVFNVLYLHWLYDQVTDPFGGHHTSWKPELDQDDLLYMEEILWANPSLHLDKIQDKLTSVWNANISIATISQALWYLNLTQKSTTRAAAQCDEELHMLWEAEMAEYTDPEVFVFLDENAVDKALLSEDEVDHYWEPIVCTMQVLYREFDILSYQH